MITKKDRKHSGRKTVFIKKEDYPYQETFWDDWIDYNGYVHQDDHKFINTYILMYIIKNNKKHGKS